MSLLGDLRAGLAANIRGGLDGWQVSPYRLASPTPPGVQIVRGIIRPHQAFLNGRVDYDFTVQAFVAFNDDRGAQKKLDELLDSGVMVEAIESDKTLGGKCEDLSVSGELPAEQILVGADNMARVIAEWTVTILVNGST